MQLVSKKEKKKTLKDLQKTWGTIAKELLFLIKKSLTPWNQNQKRKRWVAQNHILLCI